MSTSEMQYAHPPAPPSERGAWVLAGGLVLLGALALALALSGVLGGSAAAKPPPIVLAAATPAAAAPHSRAAAVARPSAAIVQAPTQAQQRLDALRFSAAPRAHIPRRWM